MLSHGTLAVRVLHLARSVEAGDMDGSDLTQVSGSQVISSAKVSRHVGRFTPPLDRAGSPCRVVGQDGGTCHTTTSSVTVPGMFLGFSSPNTIVAFTSSSTLVKVLGFLC